MTQRVTSPEASAHHLKRLTCWRPLPPQENSTPKYLYDVTVSMAPPSMQKVPSAYVPSQNAPQIYDNLCLAPVHGQFRPLQSRSKLPSIAWSPALVSKEHEVQVVEANRRHGTGTPANLEKSLLGHVLLVL
jgi:hypothetical protein